MGERVETGGLMSFNYSKEERSKLSKEQKDEIDKGYEAYYERKRKEKRKRFFIVILIIIIIIAGLAVLLLK